MRRTARPVWHVASVVVAVGVASVLLLVVPGADGAPSPAPPRGTSSASSSSSSGGGSDASGRPPRPKNNNKEPPAPKEGPAPTSTVDGSATYTSDDGSPVKGATPSEAKPDAGVKETSKSAAGSKPAEEAVPKVQSSAVGSTKQRLQQQKSPTEEAAQTVKASAELHKGVPTPSSTPPPPTQEKAGTKTTASHKKKTTASTATGKAEKSATNVEEEGAGAPTPTLVDASTARPAPPRGGKDTVAPLSVGSKAATNAPPAEEESAPTKRRPASIRDNTQDAERESADTASPSPRPQITKEPTKPAPDTETTRAKAAERPSAQRLARPPTSPPVPQVPVHTPEPATKDPLELARRAQDRADNVGRDLSSAQSKVRDVYRAHVARATSYRNRLLARVPHFWYDALLGLPRYDHFLTVPSNESPESLAAMASVSAASEHGYEDPSVQAVRAWERSQETSHAATPAADMTHPNNVDDHYILRHFLEEVSCHLVDGKSDLERSELDRLVEAGIAGDGVPSDIATSHATKVQEHSRRSSPRQYVEIQSAITEEMYRVMLRFKRNPYFADRVLYKQLPASHAHMLSTSDEDALATEGREATLGHGNSISWSTKRTRVAHLKDYTRSIFGIFDEDYYAASDADTRASLRMRAAGFVSSVCTYLDPNPLPYWERRDSERSAVIARLRALYAHPNEHYKPPGRDLFGGDDDDDDDDAEADL